jgi:hypothetical protein
MRQFMTTVMALTAFGAMVATSQAENAGGAPVRNGDQCFTYSTFVNVHDGRFGYWGPCPPGSPASRYGTGSPGTATAGATTPRRAARRSRTASH